MSHEHVVANWVSDLVPPAGGHLSCVINISKAIPGSTIIAPEWSTSHQGTVGQRKIRSVCRHCNNNWMNDIQKSAKPLLSPLIQGIWAKFDHDIAHQLAVWTAMTVMNIDCSFPNKGGISALDRKYIYERRLPPPDWKIWIGKRSGGDGIAIYHRPFALIDRRELPIFSQADIMSDHLRNAQITTLEMGQLILHACSGPPEIMAALDEIPYGRYMGIMPIFPQWFSDILDWRRIPALGSDDVDRLANEVVHALLARKDPA
jgi:hypothetical protein